jgi:penicillin-binding protein 1A
MARSSPASGHVVAAVGNRAYEQLQFDLATQARRQPGSTFKTFVLAAAIADGWHPDDRLDGRQGTVATPTGAGRSATTTGVDYPLTDAGRRHAAVDQRPLRPAGLEVGIPRVAALAHAMGVRSPVPPDDPQITIGGGGSRSRPWTSRRPTPPSPTSASTCPTPVSHIEDRDGTVVWVPDHGRSRCCPSAAYVTTEVLREVVEHGTGAGRPRDRLAGRGQDRHHLRPHRRLVRGHHANPLRRGVAGPRRGP